MTAVAAKHMPYDLRAEVAVLGAVLLESQDHWPTVRDILGDDGAEAFYSPRNAEVFRAIARLGRANKPIDTVLVHAQLEATGRLEKAGGAEYLMSLTETIPTFASVEEHAKRISQFASLRRVMAEAARAISAAQSGVADPVPCIEAFERLAGLCEAASTAARPVSMAEAIDRSYAQLLERRESPNRLRGHATGFARLDRATSGFAAGDLIVGAGRPGMGKTAFALNIAGHNAASGKHVLFVSLEMTADGLADRMLAARAQVDLRRLRTADIRPGEWAPLTSASAELSEIPISLIEDRDITIADLRQAARRHKRRVGELSLIVVDYLQLLRPVHREQNREREIAEISSALKSMAGELSCPVLALSQLNRGVEARTDKRPMLSDLRESGAIEQDADAVLFLYRDEVYHPDTADKGVAEVIIAKQRSGPTGTIKLRWSAEYTRFDNLETHEPAYAN